MKNYFVILLLLFFLISCREKEKVENGSHINTMEEIAVDSTTINADMIVMDIDSVKISPLPFDADYRWDAMNVLVSKSPKVYNLPNIKKFYFINIGYEKDTICRDTDEKKTKYTPNNILKFSEFRYKLPSISVYDIYIVCDNEMSKVYKIDEVKRNECLDFMHPIYGYLILYNVNSHEAIVFGIYYDGINSGNSIRRTFYIDETNENYNILLWDNINYYYEEEGIGHIEDSKYEFTVTILTTGEIVINNPEIIEYTPIGEKVIIRKPNTVIVSPDGKIKSTTF